MAVFFIQFQLTKTISCSLPNLNTDGTITRTHLKRQIKCCALLHCTQCKHYLHNGSLLPAQSNITNNVTALRVGGLPHHCNNEQIYHSSHNTLGRSICCLAGVEAHTVNMLLVMCERHSVMESSATRFQDYNGKKKGKKNPVFCHRIDITLCHK